MMMGLIGVWRVFLPILLLVFVAPAGCMPVPPECRSEQVICIGLVTDDNGLNDYSLNEQAWQVLQEARQDGVVVDIIESIDARDYKKNVAYFADMGYDLVFTCGYSLADVTLDMAEKYPQVSFVMLGQAPPELDAPENLAGVVFPQEQAGVWAGMLSAFFSETRIVGAVFANPEIPSAAAYARGFALGAQSVDARVIFYEQGSFESSLNDPEWGEIQSLALDAQGADVIFAYGGSTGISALEQAAGRVIGVEVDFARRFPSMRDRLVASIVFDLSILKEIALTGRVTQPIYPAGYKVLRGGAPLPEILPAGQ